MKIIYEHESKHAGMVVLQTEPQTRTISTPYSFKRLHFPYVLHIIAYEKKLNKYHYNGIFKLGLSVYFSQNPVDSLETEIRLPPIEASTYGRYGLICTPHQYDCKEFDTRDELISFVSDLWWQIQHNPFPGWVHVSSLNQMMSLKSGFRGEFVL